MQEQFVVFKIFTSAIYSNALEIMLLLANNLHEKHMTEIQDGQNFGSVHMLFLIALVFHGKCTGFQPIRRA